MELCKLCDFTCLTTGGLMFHTNSKHSRLEGPQEYKCALCDYTAYIKLHPYETQNEIAWFFVTNVIGKIQLQCEECKFSCTKESVFAKHMYRKHDGLVSKPNHECKICAYTCSIKQVLSMHMHKEHNGAAPVQKSSDMCLFTSHLSHILKNPIDRKHLGILKTFE